jgi:uncharacterized phage protein (TIGR01671 family)
MEQILFRAISEDTGNWEYGSLHRFEELAVIINKKGGNLSQHNGVKPETVGQFTGLLDRNGVRIFEGDIRREEIEFDEGDTTEYYVCTWIKEWCRFSWLHVIGEYQDYLENGVIHMDKQMIDTFGVFDYESDKTVICGNIHQNPNLLKG